MFVYNMEDIVGAVLLVGAVVVYGVICLADYLKKRG